ncbi:LTA synthase family protein [Halarcobacter anaerophilus]|uniref:Phosphoglycerol transferase n=1 Tax=Halarcobacter anaerophilus TaxID=877500 RepID=A0A4V1LQI1_9BACT|nr:alkaline phosphatase family protein [Halarcobacter anaerophilus]QDF29542.1 phosphoglycerol transferase [Halarcobacter anaerophilus]RXJ64778.1 phosphoglycerol transferase [Halarcobacter anaerophilus]
MNTIIMSKVLNIFKKLIFAHIIFLVLMSIFRLVFFIYYSPLNSLNGFYKDIAKAFFLGFRIDLTVIGYIQVLPTLFLIILYYIKKESLLNIFNKFLLYYIFICYFIVSLFLCTDFGFYSYFKEHINILLFGFFDDDTEALLVTFWQNYHIVLILALFFMYLSGLFFSVKKIFNIKDKSYNSFFGLKISALIFFIIFILNFLAVRGTLGMYPLGKMIPNVSTNSFINKVSHNGFRAYTNALSAREKYLARKYDLLKVVGYDKNIAKAFEVYKSSKDINRDDLLKNITNRTEKKDDKQYNVVVIMVESFGMPILKYQSDDFNILGSLKKHFDEDTLFTNFISEGDGTISSLESLLLNIPHRPKSFAFSQSIYKQTPFTYTPAFLYDSAGYETTFVYGGDLTWRNLGNFVKYQGYKNVEGKINIYEHLNDKSKPKEDYFHPWGIYDQYLMKHILKKLENSDNKKQFIVALTTNNHPPYNVPKDYKRNSLIFNEKIKKHITGDIDLAKQRFASYAYAVDQIGKFLDEFKKTKYKDNTIIAITADNNTIDGIMKYDNNQILNSKNIPLYFYIPKELKEKLNIDMKVAGSHKDIFPTLYNLTLKDKNYISIGTNLFDNSKKHYGFNGSLVINNKNIAKRFDNLNIKNEPMLEYYKANLAITEYLIKQYNKKGK